MSPLSSKSALIVDDGLNAELAPRLAREFGEVAYWSPSITAFPQHPQSIVGAGFEDVLRVPLDKLYDAIPAADLIVFPDLYMADLQGYLRDQGKRVWGSGSGEQLELDRIALRDYCKQQGLPAFKYELAHGMDELEEALRADEECFVKISKYRGDTETHHHLSWKQSEAWFADLVSHLGPLGDGTIFILDPPIDGCEFGADLLTVDGRFPRRAMYGPEIKDAGYKGQVTANLPPHLDRINQALAPWFKQNRYRNLFSTEARGEYFIDLAARFPAPPSASFMENVKNLGEVMWWGAAGEMVEPDYEFRFVTEIIGKAQWSASGHWLALEFPAKLRRWVKFKHGTRIGKTWYAIPHPSQMEEVVSVVGLADSEAEADRLAMERIGEVHGDTFRFAGDMIEQAKKVIEEGKGDGLIQW